MTLSLNNPSLLMNRAFIGGEWVGARSGATMEVDNPATGEIIGVIADCDEADTQAAVDAAEAAWSAWRARTAGDRAALLERWYALVMDNLVDLARIMTAEQGKPIAEAQGEIRYAASFIKWFAEEARRIDGSIIPAPEADRRILLLKEPARE